MEVENKKRDGDGNGKRRKPTEDDDGNRDRVAPPKPPADEEVEEFFAILKRTQVAVNYFRRRNGVSFADGDLTARPSWRPTFRLEDFDGVKKDPEENPDTGLDLNSEPAQDISDFH